MKHLNTLLTDKKGTVLHYQDRITNLQAELAELRDKIGKVVGVLCCGCDKVVGVLWVWE